MDDIAVHSVHANHGVQMQATHCDAQEAGGKRDLCHFGCARFLLRLFFWALVFLDGIELLLNLIHAVDHLAAAVDETAREKQAPENKE